jgi:hypothetical protein
MYSYKVGQRVRFLDEPSGGVLKAVEGEQAWVEDAEGFVRPFALTELVPDARFPVEDVPPSQHEAHLAAGQKRMRPTGKRAAPDKLEVDLHFDKLVAYPKNYDAYACLQIQLNEVRKALAKARKQGAKRLILIHGVGQGRLREEVHQLLEREEDLTFYDASFAEYGQGATEVEWRGGGRGKL